MLEQWRIERERSAEYMAQRRYRLQPAAADVTPQPVDGISVERVA